MPEGTIVIERLHHNQYDPDGSQSGVNISLNVERENSGKASQSTVHTTRFLNGNQITTNIILTRL